MRTLLLILLSTLVVTFPGYASDLLHGRSVYEVNCAGCHGGFGKGDGPRAGTMNPKPADFIDPKVMTNIAPERFERAVVQGLPNVVQHTFGHLLTPEEVSDVINYIKSLVR